MGSSPSKGTSAERESAGELPKLNSSERVLEVSIYGNGKVAGGLIFGTHHVLVVLKTDAGDYVLLEVERCRDGLVHINKQTSKSLDSVLEKRNNTKANAIHWRSEEVNKVSCEKVNKIISINHKAPYHLTNQSCRTFVDDICKACGASIRCNRPDEWSLW